jgi:hypothetical protein
MEDWIIPIAIVCLVLAPVAAGIAWLATRSRVALGVFAVTALLDAVWWVVLVLVGDGLIDCHPCSREQTTAAYVLFYTPPLMAAVLVGSLTAIALRVRRGLHRQITTEGGS